MKMLLFVSSHCSHCPNAVAVVNKVVPKYYDKGLSYRKIRMKTSEGKELSSEYGVMSVPSILIFDKDGYEIKRIVGAPGEGHLRNVIEKALGLKKSFWSKILGA